jgi:type IV secretion system protein VirB4
LEPLLFYILHRANAVIADRQISSVFKAFFIDEAWVFLKNPSIQRYVVEALKTWRKHNAAMVLSTQSLDELKRSDILDVIIESCATKIFLANPDMDRDLYRRQFHLNETEVELISGLIPKQQFLIKTPELAKVANLTVDAKSYWLYTNDPYDNTASNEAWKFSREDSRDCSLLSRIVDGGQRPALHIPAPRARGICHRNHSRCPVVSRGFFA